LNIPADLIEEAQIIMNKFITGKFRFSKELCTSPVNKGGLGMINLNNFITSLQCSWIKRAGQEDIDNWRTDLRSITGDNIYSIEPNNVSYQHPVLKTLAESFFKFKKSYFSTGRNFFKASLIGNPCLVNNKREKQLVGNTLLNNLPVQNNALSRITVGDISMDAIVFVSRQELSEICNVEYSAQEYNNIKTAIKDSWYLINKIQKNLPNNDCSDSISDFINKFKKGSKPFRRILDKLQGGNLILSKNQRIKTFFRLCDLPVPDEKKLENLYVEWTVQCYPLKLREFIFKFRNNLLGLNVRVVHFNDNVGRGCTFCRIQNGNGPLPDETFLHLFYSCPHSKKLVNGFLGKYFTMIDLNDEQQVKTFTFLGEINPDYQNNFFISTVAIYLSFFIWQCKLQKKIPLMENCLNDIFYSVDIIRRISSKFREHMNLNLPLCRVWSEEASRRR
jgi:hypothetical protein